MADYPGPPNKQVSVSHSRSSPASLVPKGRIFSPQAVSGYRPEIDGLRAVAVGAVILFHAGFRQVGGGFVGVDVFFVISGYLITRIILSELERGTFSLVDFYERRARRILPALFLVLIVSLVLGWFLLDPPGMKDFSQSLVAVALFGSNVYFWRTSGYFDGAGEEKPLLHTWSLGVEEQFYLLYPLLLLLLWKKGRRIILPLLFIGFVASLALAEWGSSEFPIAAFYLLPTRAWELLLGGVVALLMTRPQFIPEGRAVKEILGWVGAVLIGVAALFYSEQTPFPGVYALVPTVGTALIILFSSQNTSLGQILGSRVFVGIGLISYGAYLWHQPLFAFARHAIPSGPGREVFLVLAVVSLGLAYLSWRFVEKPWRTRSRFSRKTVFSFAAAGTVLLVLMGSLGTTNGFASRFDPDLVSALAPGGAYVAGAYDAFREEKQEWSDDGKPKILLVGDSQSQDLFNGLSEAGLTEELDLLIRFVSVRCGVLFVEESTSLELAEPQHREGCREAGGLLEDESTLRHAREADQVWVISAWREVDVDFLPESIANLQQVTEATVVVWGRKSFGNVSVPQLLMSAERRAGLVVSQAQSKLDIQAHMRDTAPGDIYVDMQSVVCREAGDAEDECRPFDRNGLPKSDDGLHLTPPGAEHVGRWLLDAFPCLVNEACTRDVPWTIR